MIIHNLLRLVWQVAKNQAALAAAKARFEQQQKENDEIAERNKRQRLGLPEPRPAVPEVCPVKPQLSAFDCHSNTVTKAGSHDHHKTMSLAGMYVVCWTQYAALYCNLYVVPEVFA